MDREKEAEVVAKELEEKGYRVCMVEDGIDDALAMTEADLSFAVGLWTFLRRKKNHEKDVVKPLLGSSVQHVPHTHSIRAVLYRRHIL